MLEHWRRTAPTAWRYARRNGAVVIPDAQATKRAVRRLYRLEVTKLGLIRDVLSWRPERCAPKCKGWFVDAERLVPVRCDDCASLNGYAAVIGDDEIALLPEARRAAHRASAKAHKAGELVTVDAEGGIEFESHAGHSGSCGLAACTLQYERERGRRDCCGASRNVSC